MKVSKFIFMTNYPATDEILLYNTLNGSLLSFDKKYQDEIDCIIEQKHNININTELKTLLAEEGFLIDENFDEIGIVIERNRLGIKDGNRLDVIIMPNMNCNFSCGYCYEEHHKSQMEINTKRHLIEWLRKMIPRFKVVLISWFGGEPLLSYDSIVELQSIIVNLCEEHDVALSSHITTNGYLLNQKRIDTLLSLGVHSYQITLDGTPETHNEMRPLRGGGKTFDKIFENICLLARSKGNPHIKLRVNYDRRNIDKISELLQLFPIDVRGKCMLVCETIFKETFGQVVETMGRGNEIEDIYKLAETIGFIPDNSVMDINRLTYCYADRENQFLINYNGDIFKCTVQKFNSKNRLGYLSNDGQIIWEDKRLDKWHNVNSFEEKCYQCVFMPLCMGGCRKLRAVWGTVGDDCTAPFEGFEKKIRNFYEKSLK